MLSPALHRDVIEAFVKSNSHLGTILRPVSLQDSEFILTLRSDPRLNRHISHTSPSLDDQVRWISGYLGRYDRGEEAYFAVVYDGKPCGTIRIYDYDSAQNSCVSGSWLMMPGSPGSCAFSSTLLDYDICFRELGFSKVFFDVRNENKSVWKFHESIGARFTGEDKMNRFYEITTEAYPLVRAKLDRFANQLYERPIP